MTFKTKTKTRFKSFLRRVGLLCKKPTELPKRIRISKTINPDGSTIQHERLTKQPLYITLDSSIKKKNFVDNISNNVLNFFTIDMQDHDWSGHPNSGPNSNTPANFYLDATYLLIKFLNQW